MRYLIYIGILVIVILLVVFVVSLFSGSEEDQLGPGFHEGYEHTYEHEYIEPETSLNPDELEPFDELLVITPRDVFQEVLDLTYLRAYGIYPCDTSPYGEKVLLFTTRYTQDPRGNHFRDAIAAVRNWESYIFEDIGHFIFPDLEIQDRSGAVEFSGVPGTGYRRATAFVGGEERPLHYGWLLNYVLFSSTEQCLERIINSIYEPI